MKKLFIYLGFVLLVAVIVVAGIAYKSQQEKAQYETTAAPYVKMFIPELSTWDVSIIKGYMAPEALKDISEERIAKVVKYLSRLGALKATKEPVFSKLFTKNSVEEGKKIVVIYTIDAEYENGDANLTISLLDLGNSFQVAKFDINSAALAAESETATEKN